MVAEQSGHVCSIDNLQMARIAGLAGAPKIQGAGIDLMRKLGDEVAAGDVLYRVYASFGSDLEFARRSCARSNGYLIGDSCDVPQVYVEF